MKEQSGIGHVMIPTKGHDKKNASEEKGEHEKKKKTTANLQKTNFWGCQIIPAGRKGLEEAVHRSREREKKKERPNLCLPCLRLFLGE